MNLFLVGLLLGTLNTLWGAALENRMKCSDCSRGDPSSSCREMVTTCGDGNRCVFLEHSPQPVLEQSELSGNLTLPHHHPACVTAHHCNQEGAKLVGDVPYTHHRDCCVGDLCNGVVARTVAPACTLAAVATTLAWVLPGLWRGWWE